MRASQNLQTDRSELFQNSWHCLLRSGWKILNLGESEQWQQASQLLSRRQAFSDQHFQHFPIGPQTRSLYMETNLQDLFSIEEALCDFQRTYKRELKQAQGQLRLVS